MCLKNIWTNKKQRKSVQSIKSAAHLLIIYEKSLILGVWT